MGNMESLGCNWGEFNSDNILAITLLRVFCDKSYFAVNRINTFSEKSVLESYNILIGDFKESCGLKNIIFNEPGSNARNVWRYIKDKKNIENRLVELLVMFCFNKHNRLISLDMFHIIELIDNMNDSDIYSNEQEAAFKRALTTMENILLSLKEEA